jgi:membrane-bound lytic murein transglycosylase A
MPVRSLRIVAAGASVLAMTLASSARPAAAQPALTLRGASAEPLTFAALDGWSGDNQAAAFGSFLNSCKAILGGGKPPRAARPIASGLYDVCRKAHAAGPLTRDDARAFFEQNFRPVRIVPNGQPDGFFTGYYETVIAGSRTRSADYNVPIYRLPKSAALARANRLAIEDGLLAGKNLELIWLTSPIDAFFAQIQGSARVHLTDGKTIRIG